MLCLETALVAPVAMLTFALVAQLAWVGFQAACFDHAVNTAAWSVTSDDARAPDADAVVHAAVTESWVPLNDAAVEVAGARIFAQEASATAPTNGPNDRELYLVERTTRTVRTVRTTAQTAYTIQPIVPLPTFEPVRVERPLDRTFVTDAKFEVS